MTELDPMGHHVHEPGDEERERNVPVIILAVIVALACAVITWLLLTRGHNTSENRHLIDQLACEVQQLGGSPVAGASCPPATPHPTPAPTVTYSPKVVVVPGGGSKTILVPVPASSGGSNPQPHPQPSSSPSSRPSPSPSHSPSPSPTPLVCVAGHCITTHVGLQPTNARQGAQQ